jgi:hypothetical protein
VFPARQMDPSMLQRLLSMFGLHPPAGAPGEGVPGVPGEGVPGMGMPAIPGAPMPSDGDQDELGAAAGAGGPMPMMQGLPGMHGVSPALKAAGAKRRGFMRGSKGGVKHPTGKPPPFAKKKGAPSHG